MAFTHITSFSSRLIELVLSIIDARDIVFRELNQELWYPNWLMETSHGLDLFPMWTAPNSQLMSTWGSLVAGGSFASKAF